MNPRDRLKLLGAGLVGAAALSARADSAGSPAGSHWQVVVQISDSLDQAHEGLVNIQNVLAIDPGIKFIVVGYGKAIGFLRNGTQTPTGALFSGLIGDLANLGVEFRACKNTLDFLHIPASDLVLEASLVQAGAYEIIRLQTLGWHYLKP